MEEETKPEKEKILGTGILKSLKQKIADWISTRQPILVSGTNIKTVDGETLLGSGDLPIKLKTINSTSLKGEGNIGLQPTLVSGTNIKTINNKTILGSGNLDIDTGGELYADYGSNVDGALTQKFSTQKLRGQKVEIGDSSSATTNGSVAVGPMADAQGESSVAIGRDATTEDAYGVAVGPKTTAETGGAIALGYDITSGTGSGSIAIGYNSRGSTLPASTDEETSTDATIAIGFNANAAEQAAIAVGNDSEARFQCMAIGNNKTKARGRRNIAIGAQAEATAESGEDSDGAIAMGILSKTTGTHGIAIGYGAKASERNTVSMSLNAEATKEGAVAIGTNSTADNQYSVALGHSSVTSADHTVSVGSPTLKRRIMNVAPAVDDNDAVTKKQLDDAVTGGGSGSGGGGYTVEPITITNVTTDAYGTTTITLDKQTSEYDQILFEVSSSPFARMTATIYNNKGTGYSSSYQFSGVYVDYGMFVSSGNSGNSGPGFRIAGGQVRAYQNTLQVSSANYMALSTDPDDKTQNTSSYMSSGKVKGVSVNKITISASYTKVYGVKLG